MSSACRAAGRPLVGLTLDRRESGGYSALAWYALRENYAQAVSAAGGLPVMLSHEVDLAPETMYRLDALVVTGGDFDVDPSYYGEANQGASRDIMDCRTAYEMAVVQAALAADKPVLGICGGQQLLNVALGGALVQDIAREIPEALAHEQPNPRTEPGHEVTITPDSLLARIVQTPRMRINSAHHQAVKTLGPGVIVNAAAPDGVIEGIEAPDRYFCLGVQWHPEYKVDPGDAKIFTALIDAAVQSSGAPGARSAHDGERS